MKLLYKPFGLIFSALGGLAAAAVFKRLWKGLAHEDDSPDAKDLHRSWRQVVLASALQGAIFGGVKALIDRAGATGYARVTGVWPGRDTPPKTK